MPFSRNRKPESRIRQALVAALSFLALGMSWLVVTTALTYAFGRPFMESWQISRGIMFFVVTSALIYALLRHQARQHALQEETYHAIMEEAQDCIILADARGNFVEFNQSASRMLGYEREVLLGMNINDLIDPEDLKKQPVDGEKLEVGKAVSRQRRLRRKDGSFVQVDVLAHRISPTRILAVMRDVSEGMRLAAELRQSEERTRAMVASALDAIISMNASGDVTDWNAAAEKLFGWSRAEAVGMKLAELIIPPTLGPRHTAALAKYVLTGEDHILGKRLELTARARDGREFPVELSVTLARKEPLLFTGFVRDLTEARMAQDNLRRSETRFEAMARNSADAVQLLDAQGFITWESASCEKLLGFKPTELVGKNVMELLHPDEHESTKRIMGEAMKTPGFTVTLVQRVRHKDGLYRWLESTGQNLLDDPDVGAIVVNYRDVTARVRADEALRASETRYRKLIERASDAVVLANAEGKAFQASPATLAATGFSPEEFCALDVFSRLHPDDLPAVRESFAAILLPGAKPSTAVIRFQHKAGHWVWLESVATNLLADPDINAIVSNFRDVTQRVELESQLQQAVKMDAIGRLAGGVAHDFNNLLTAITGYGHLLLGRIPEDRTTHKQVIQILKAADRAAELTRQLLTFSRRQVLQPVVLDMNARVRDIEKLIQRLIGEGIELVVNLTTDNTQVRADPSQVDQVIMNLCINARDAMLKGGRMTLDTRITELDADYARAHTEVKAGKYVQFSVTDTGMGMDTATQARIFEPFFTTKEKGKGTGLGLAVVYGVVKQSGGHIWVYSEPGHGTVFKVYLPLADGRQPVDEEDTAKETSVRARGREHVLVAEDEDAVREFVTEMLRDAGYRVTAAVDGLDALEKFEHSEAIDLVLTDVMMPHIGGRELAQRLLQQRPSLRILFMSGYTDAATAQLNGLNPEVNFMQKPFSPDALLERIRSVLDAASRSVRT